MIRRFGSPPKHDRTYTLRPGAYAILPREGQLLLTVQYAEQVEVQLPGGGIDPGETPINALHREVYEETGWHIARPRRLGVFRRFVFMPDYDIWAEKICHIFVAHPTRQIGPPTEPDHDVLWADPHVAAEIVENPGDQHFIRRFAG